MKVLMNAVSARRGGIVTYTRNVISMMRNTGMETLVAVPPNLALIDQDSTIPIDVGRYGPLRRFIWDQLVWRRIVHRVRPDVLFSSANFGLLWSPTRQLLLMREGGLFNPFYLRNVFPRLGLTARLVNLLRRRLMRLSVRNADLVMFPSETLRDWITKFEPSVEARAVINHYGIDLRKFSLRPPAIKRAPKADPIRVAFVSVYYPHKDPMTAVRAVQAIRDGGCNIEIRITMDRDDFDPWPEMLSVYNELVKYQRSGTVVLGSVGAEDLPGFYRDTDIFVFPSVSETFGFPLVEAMASGVPVIAADTLINREICGPAALYFAAGDHVTLSKCIQALIDRPDLYAWFNKNGHERAHRLYDWNGHLVRLEQILASLGDS